MSSLDPVDLQGAAEEIVRSRDVRVARTGDQVEQLRALWASLGPRDIDTDPDHFLTVVDHDPAVIGPHVIVVPIGSGTSIVVARLVRERFAVRLGYRTLFSLPARALVVSFDGVLGAEDDHRLRAAVDAVRYQLEVGAADVVVWQKLPVDGVLDRAVRGSVRAGLVTTRAVVPRYSMDASQSWEQTLARRPSKSRQRIRRESSVFRRDHRDRWELRRIGADTGAAEIAEIDQVTATTYQAGLGVGNSSDGLPRRLRELAQDRGWFRGWVLRLDDRPAAFWWGMQFGDCFFPGSTGYVPEHAAAGVGSVAFAAMLEDLCDDPAIASVAFGYGDAEYKLRFATEVVETADVLVFADRLRPRLLLMLLRCVDAVTGRVREVVERSGVERRIKRRWRSRAAARGPRRSDVAEPGSSGRAGSAPAE